MSVDVFHYQDLRKYLLAYYEAKKAGKRAFSYRSFSRRIGVNSPNHLKRVIDGERQLTPDMAKRYTTAMGLSGEAATYMCDLARFSQAKTASDRALAWRAMTHSKQYRQAHALEMKHAAYCSTWFIPAVRELAARPDFQADPAWIATQLIPTITKTEAKTALKTLLDLGLLRMNEDGSCIQGTSVLSTGPETRGMHIAAYHRAMLERASESIDLVAAAERDISSLTMCVSPETLAELKARIQAFRKELIAIAQADESPARVVQFNFQLFPLSKDLP